MPTSTSGAKLSIRNLLTLKTVVMGFDTEVVGSLSVKDKFHQLGEIGLYCLRLLIFPSCVHIVDSHFIHRNLSLTFAYVSAKLSLVRPVEPPLSIKNLLLTTSSCHM